MNQKAFNHRFANLLALLAGLGAIALPLGALAIWIFWDNLVLSASANLGHAFNLSALGPGARLAGLAVSMSGALLWSYGLLALRGTFREAASGRPLSKDAVIGFRKFTWVALIMVFVGIAQNTLYIMIYSVSDPALDGQLSIQFGTRELGALFIGLLFVFVAHVFAAGHSAANENESFL